MNKPSLPRGTRDFGPEQMRKRQYIIETISRFFKLYGFEPLETPSMENLSVLTGKYGEEGDQLIFKILNSGDFLQGGKIPEVLQGKNYKEWISKISEKALRYDLTVPFARFLVMNRHELVFPFRRYQIQPVWRADRPQKGRYREFYQCDADIAGTDSLLAEAELIALISDVFSSLNIPVVLKINNRKVLTAFASVLGAAGKETDLCVAIDKWDKIGEAGVLAELAAKGFDPAQVKSLFEILNQHTDPFQKLQSAHDFLSEKNADSTGIDELRTMLDYAHAFGKPLVDYEIDFTLARGLNYYTGAIFEVKAKNVQIGSISGGGRYDNLTGLFGMEGVSGVGISFGIDRIYDVLEETNGFPSFVGVQTKVLMANFGLPWQQHALEMLSKIRQEGVVAEIYPKPEKMKKQFSYADAKKIPFVVTIGENEWIQGKAGIKNMEAGTQEVVDIVDLPRYLALA